jgi:integrase
VTGVNVLIREDFSHNITERLIGLIPLLGDDIRFDDDKWICHKLRRSPSQNLAQRTLRFNKTPAQYNSIVKFFVLKRYENGRGFETMYNAVKHINPFLKFYSQRYPECPLSSITQGVILEYKMYVEQLQYSQATKENRWSVLNAFFDELAGWRELPAKKPTTSLNPFSRDRKKIGGKYIPETVLRQLDAAFKNENIPVYQRAIYWILRSFPSRISEVVGAKLDCLKPFNDNWVLFLPSWKQNGGYMEPEMRALHIKCEGHGKYLVDLLRQQRVMSESLQDKLPEDERGLLFTFNEVRFKWEKHMLKGSIEYAQCNAVRIANVSNTLRFLSSFCRYNHITDDNGRPYTVTTHQFRHNGITDRLYAGFSPVEIRYMTAQKSDTMLLNSYNHLEQMPEKLIEKQRRIQQNRSAQSNRVYFKGRILNMDEQLENRLLKNLRSHKLKHGICSDITGCKNETLYDCLACSYFIPDYNDLGYYEEQVNLWSNKIQMYKAQPFLVDKAINNLNLYNKIVARIKGELEVH